MKRALTLILSLATLVLAGGASQGAGSTSQGVGESSQANGPTREWLSAFVKEHKRAPNRCVAKGETFKCVGYEAFEGVIVNVTTGRIYMISQDHDVEVYREDSCQEFYVEIDNGEETIKCTEGESLFEAHCDTRRQIVEVQEYDELGIPLAKKVNRDADPAYCRNAFHFQYGNKSEARYSHIYGQTPPAPERPMGLVIEKGNRDSTSIMKVVHKHTSELQHIYKKYQRRKAKFGGEVVLRMTISPNGEIIKLSMISSTTGNDSFDDEVKLAVYRWLFGRARVTNTTVTLPITFGD